MNTLPQAIAGYIEAANAGQEQRLATWFDEDATVHDEGQLRQGREQIATWAREARIRYQSTIEALGLEQAGSLHRLRATVRGNFPGSPVVLNFHFRLQSERIQSLEITP